MDLLSESRMPRKYDAEKIASMSDDALTNLVATLVYIMLGERGAAVGGDLASC